MNKEKRYTEILFICLCISCFVILILIDSIYKKEPVCERMHLDEIDKSKDIISSEEMAEKLVEIYETRCEKYKNYEGINKWNHNVEIPYDVHVIYDEQQYEWIVQFQAMVPEGYSILDGFYDVGVRRDNGMLSQIPR